MAGGSIIVQQQKDLHLMLHMLDVLCYNSYPSPQPPAPFFFQPKKRQNVFCVLKVTVQATL